MSATTVLPSGDDLALRDAVRDVLARERSASPAQAATPERRAAMWRLAGELAWTGVALPEQSGGIGMSVGALGLVVEEAGYALFPAPLLSSVLASTLVVRAGGDPSAFAGGIAGTVVASRHGVPDADMAEAFVQVRDDTISLLESDEVEVASQAAVDPGRPLFSVTPRAAGTAIGVVPDASAWLRALSAAELVGVAARALDVAVAHAHEREQFGQPIGAFQAVKHRLADSYVAVETARSLTRAALTEGDVRLAAMAKARASEAALGGVKAAIQVSGALGITAEHELPWLLRRARVGGQLFGEPHGLYAEIGRGS